MTREENAALNQTAIRQLKARIDADYPPGQFVALHEGRIVADAPDADLLLEKLAALGIDPLDALADRAGEDTLSELLIL